MKNSIYFIIIFLVFMGGCFVQKNEYPDVTIAQVLQDLKWDYSFDTVKNILEKKYGLKYSQEINQDKHSSNYKEHEFLGGSFIGIKTDRWIPTFLRDSLYVVIIKVLPETAEQKAKILSTINNNICNSPYQKFSKIKNEWILSENEKAICKLHINIFEKEMFISFCTDKDLSRDPNYLIPYNKNK
ncbi:MAG: hypothetical protein M0Q21_03375 [Ignavibacteriaceae bacterium]|nr:hypothetical protein [Ignavibacteriaceae bacterium]